MSFVSLATLFLTASSALADDPAPPAPAGTPEVPVEASAVLPEVVAPVAPVADTEPVAPADDCKKLTMGTDKEACMAEWTRFETARAAWIAAHPKATEKGAKAKRSNSNRMEAEATDE